MQLIDPKMSIDTIKSYIEVWDCKGCLPYGETQHNVMAVDDLQYLPTIEAEPVLHGRWIRNATSEGYHCSKCGHHVDSPIDEMIDPRDYKYFLDKYCGGCGARMDATDTNVGR